METGAILAAIVAFITSVISGGISIWTNIKNRKVLEDIEYLKTELQKESIAYQIYQTELSKKEFEKIDSLYQALIDYIEIFYSNYLNVRAEQKYQREPEQLIKEIIEKTDNVFVKLRKSKIYLDKETYDEISYLLKQTYNKIEGIEGIRKKQQEQVNIEKVNTEYSRLEYELEKIEDKLRSQLKSSKNNDK